MKFMGMFIILIFYSCILNDSRVCVANKTAILYFLQICKPERFMVHKFATKKQREARHVLYSGIVLKFEMNMILNNIISYILLELNIWNSIRYNCHLA
jgi:hypothetical protein